MLTKIFTFCFIVLSFNTIGQIYILDQAPAVITDNVEMPSPWAGGLNSAQINMIDMNFDGLEDIIAYEKTTRESFVFIATSAGKFVYTPSFGEFLPDISGWMITRDYNGDGKKDIFTSDPLGIRLYINNMPAGFDLYPVAPILTKGIIGNVNIYASQDDLPAIEDVDGDGDLDIVTMQFAGTTLEYNKNLQVENGLPSDTLVFARASENWGDIQICDCSTIISIDEDCPESGRLDHAGGHALLLFDFDGDADLDLTFSDSHCTEINFLENVGSGEEALFNTSQSNVLPYYINLPYPMPAYVDVDHDGAKDLIISPVNDGTNNYALSYENSIWLFKNLGTTSEPNFQISSQNFLQGGMIDIGLNSHPLFYDIDNDGDQDLFLGKLVDFSNNFQSGFTFYRNTGTHGHPVFELITSDAFDLGKELIYNLKGQFADITGDRRPEFIYSATSLVSGITSIFYLENTGLVTFDTDHKIRTLLNNIPFASNFTFYDLNDDGMAELFLTSSTGVQLWEKKGTEYIFSIARYKDLPINTNSLFFDDLNDDGLADLIFATAGKVKVIYDFKNNNNDVVDISLRYNLEKEPERLGQNISIASAKILGNNVPEIIMGSNTGGLKIFRDKDAVFKPEPDPFVLFPNPSDRNENLHFQSSRNLLMYVVSADGKTMMGPEYLPANEPYQLQLKRFGQGMYIIYALVDNSTSWHRKYIVVD